MRDDNSEFLPAGEIQSFYYRYKRDVQLSRVCLSSTAGSGARAA